MTPSKCTPAPIPSPEVTFEGKVYWRDSNGGLVPSTQVKAQDKLIDEAVRKVMGYAVALSDQIGRFKGHTWDDILSVKEMIFQEYGATVGGRKGNASFFTHDGLYKITVQVSEMLSFGPELEAAKALIDECLEKWSTDARPELRALVERAFETQHSGQVRQSELFRLRSLEIDDDTWREAMRALTDAIRVIGKKEYVRFYRRDTPNGAWTPITIDLAKA
ncbi:MAG: DUF3164 family protein [Pseudomonadota bacterium]